MNLAEGLATSLYAGASKARELAGDGPITLECAEEGTEASKPGCPACE